MCAERFGSYSIAATFAGIPSFDRLKSILRYLRLAPPPRWRDGHAPVGVAPAGLPEPLGERLLGLGLRDRLVLEERREAASGRGRLVLLDGHLSRSSWPSNSSIESSGWRVTTAFFHLRRVPAREPAALRLGLHPGRAHAVDAHAEDLLDRLAHLRLVGPLVHAERVLVGREQGVALLGDDRPDDHLARVHLDAAFSVSARERRLGDHEPRVADHVGDADGVGVHDAHVAQVAERLDSSSPRRR